MALILIVEDDRAILRGLEQNFRFEGYEVITKDAAAPIGDIFISATGCCDVIVGEHM